MTRLPWDGRVCGDLRCGENAWRWAVGSADVAARPVKKYVCVTVEAS